MAYIKLLIALVSFGSIGVFVNEIPMESADIVFFRTLIAAIFLMFIIIIKKERVSKEVFKENLLSMSFSGVLLGISWIFLFEAYKYSTVSIGTLTYYLSPVIILLMSPLVFGEKLTLNKVLGIIVAMVGMLIVNGGNIGGLNPKLGFIYGLGSAVTYAMLTMANKKRGEDMSALISTMVQLVFASLAVSLFLLVNKSGIPKLPTGKPLVYLLILCTYHTGIALFLFFESLTELPAQTAALLSYVDPLSALVFCSIFLGEKMTMIQVLGAVMILGGALYGEFSETSLSGSRVRLSMKD